MGDDRPPVYFDPDVDEGVGRWVYRASSLGSCERELVLWRRGEVGMPTPEWLQTRFDEGHEYEAEILNRFSEDQGLTVYGAQMQASIPVGVHAMTRGSIDGYADGVVIDAKFLGPDLYAKLQKGIDQFPHYEWQQAMYAHGLTLAGYEIERICLAMGLKDIEGKGDERQVKGIAEMNYLWVDVADLPTLAQIKARVMRLEKLAGADGLPDCPTPLQYPCPFELHHDEKPEEEWQEVEDELMAAELRRAHSLHSRASREEKAAKELKAEAKEIIERLLGKLDLNPDEKHRLSAGACRVEWVYAEVAGGVVERKPSVRKYPKFTVKGDEIAEAAVQLEGAGHG